MRAALLLTAICLAGALSAQSYSVTSGALTSGYTDLATPTNTSLVPLTTDGPFSPTGFSFDYFGATYTSFSIAASGYIIMGGGTQVSKPPAPHLVPGNVISPGWLYLDPRARLVGGLSQQIPPPGTIGWEFSGGVLQVEWNLIPMYNNTTSNTVGVRMKLLLETVSGAIEFRYGSVPTGATGATVNLSNAVCISGPAATSPQEIIPGSLAGYINNDGSVSTYPTNQFVRFTPGSNPGNTPPAVSVGRTSGLYSGSYVSGGTMDVDYGDTVSGETIFITATDADSDPVSLTATITNLGATGIVVSEWETTSASTPFTLYPASGAFNTVAGVTHTLTLTADDGTDITTYTLYIAQAAQPATPSISVSDGVNVPPGLGAIGTNRDFGDRAAGTGPGAALTITITNNGGAVLTLSGFGVSGDSGEFVVDTSGMGSTVAANGGSTTFTIAFSPTSTGAKSATVSFNHDDPNVTNPYTFEIAGNGTTSTPGPGPTPISGGGGGGGGGCVAGEGANFALLLLIAMSACLGARTLRQRVSR